MPVKTGKDGKGCYAQWGSQKKYYYKCGSESGRKRAKQKAHVQGYAVEKSQERATKSETIDPVIDTIRRSRQRRGQPNRSEMRHGLNRLQARMDSLLDQMKDAKKRGDKAEVDRLYAHVIDTRQDMEIARNRLRRMQESYDPIIEEIANSLLNEYDAMAPHVTAPRTSVGTSGTVNAGTVGPTVRARAASDRSHQELVDIQQKRQEKRQHREELDDKEEELDKDYEELQKEIDELNKIEAATIRRLR